MRVLRGKSTNDGLLWVCLFFLALHLLVGGVQAAGGSPWTQRGPVINSALGTLVAWALLWRGHDRAGGWALLVNVQAHIHLSAVANLLISRPFGQAELHTNNMLFVLAVAICLWVSHLLRSTATMNLSLGVVAAQLVLIARVERAVSLPAAVFWGPLGALVICGAAYGLVVYLRWTRNGLHPIQGRIERFRRHGDHYQVTLRLSDGSGQARSIRIPAARFEALGLRRGTSISLDDYEVITGEVLALRLRKL